MKYRTGYTKALEEGYENRNKSVTRDAYRSAMSVKKGVIGSLWDWFLGKNDSNRDGRLTGAEWQAAVEERDKLVAELNGAANYLKRLIAFWDAFATQLGDIHNELSNIVRDYDDIASVAPTVWGAFPEVSSYGKTELVPPLNELIGTADVTQELLDEIYNSLILMYEGFVNEAKAVDSEFKKQTGMRTFSARPVNYSKMKIVNSPAFRKARRELDPDYE